MRSSEWVISDRRFTLDLAFFCLPDMLQLLAGIRASGLVVVRSGEQSGVVHLNEGAIASAYASSGGALLGEETPSEAIWRMTKWTEGEIVFDPGWTPPCQTAPLSVGDVLMDGLGFA